MGHWSAAEARRPLGAGLLDLPTLSKVKEFRLELETMLGWKRLLDPIVKRLHRLKGRPTLQDPVDESNTPSMNRFVPSDKVKEWQWTRPAAIGSGEFKVIFKDVKSIELCVVELVWHRKPCRFDRAMTTPVPITLDAFLGNPARSPADSTLRPRPRTSIQYNGRYLYDAPLKTPEEGLWFSDESHEDGSPEDKRRRKKGNRSPTKRRRLHVQDCLALPVLRTRRSAIWDETVQRAAQSEEDRMAGFETMMAEFWAETLTREWEARGSLLRLERVGTS